MVSTISTIGMSTVENLRIEVTKKCYQTVHCTGDVIPDVLMAGITVCQKNIILCPRVQDT